MKSETIWRTVAAMTLTVTIVTSYPGGAPDSACPSLNPDWHGPSTATGPPPYVLSLSSATYSSNQVIQLTLSGAAFKGFLIEGRKADGSDTNPVGLFQNPTSESKLACTAFATGNGITQTSNSVKTSTQFEWKAPSTSVGDIVFNYTVVRGGAPSTNVTASDYYQGLVSRRLTPAGDRLFFQKERSEETIEINVEEYDDSHVMSVFEKVVRRARPQKVLS